MGIYLLAGIIFILFIVFIVDLIRDSRNNDGDDTRRPLNRPNMFGRYQEEFGDDDFMSYDDYRYFGIDDEEYAEEEDIDLYNDRRNIEEDDDFHMTFDNEFGMDITDDLTEEPDTDDRDHRHYD